MMKWQKILTICIVAFLGVLTAGAATTLFIINFNTDIAHPVQIIDDGSKFYAVTDAVDGYNGYRFRFKSDEGIFTVDTQNNFLNLSDLEKIELGQKYTISVCYRGDTEGGNSRYSKNSDEWSAVQHLEKPKPSLHGNVLTWQTIDHATSYIVNYGQYSQPTQSTQMDTSKFVGGIYNITVTAISSSALYKSSTSQTLEDQTIIHYYDRFSSVQLVDEGAKQYLKIVGTERVSKINVMIGGSTSQFEVEATKVDETYTYTLDITLIYRAGTVIEASPASIDQFNVSSGTTYA